MPGGTLSIYYTVAGCLPVLATLARTFYPCLAVRNYLLIALVALLVLAVFQYVTKWRPQPAGSVNQAQVGSVRIAEPGTPGPGKIITSGGMYDGVRMGVQPGDTVGIQGTLPNLILRNFTGAPGKPIVFVNYGGRAVIRGTTRNDGNFTMMGCQYVVLSGSGSKDIPYGFNISSSFKDVSALVVAGKSTHIEITRVEVSQSGFAGMMIKTDPNKNDPSTWFGNFVMQEVKVHHNYVHDTLGEGFYIGNSFWNTGQNGVYPHEIRGLELHHNVVVRAGCEGIQYSCSPGALVHHNKVVQTGISPFSNSQNAGVQISGGSSGQFYDNTIDSAQGVGLIIVGALRNGDSLTVSNVLIAHSNLFEGSSRLPAETCGVFVDERATPPGVSGGGTLLFQNVTVDGARLDGFRFYNETQRNIIQKSVVRNVSRSAFDRQPKTVPLLIDKRTVTGPGAIAKDVGYRPRF